MMRRILCTMLGVMAAAIGTHAQDPLKTLPDTYRLAFQNDYASVVRVRYAAGAKLPDHTHPGGTTVYVYLSDSERVQFKHSGNINSVVTRPAVRTGAVRIAAGREEHHAVENPASTPSDFLRVFVKTDDAGVRNLRQRMPVTDTTFENKQLRITRATVAQHQDATISGKSPSLVIEVPSGNTRWVAAGTTTTIENHDAPELSLIRIEFLTPPR